MDGSRRSNAVDGEDAQTFRKMQKEAQRSKDQVKTEKEVKTEVKKKQMEKAKEKQKFRVRLRSKLPPKEYYECQRLAKEKKEREEKKKMESTAGGPASSEFRRITIQSLLNSPVSENGEEGRSEQK